MPLTSQDRKVAELLDVISQDGRAASIVNMWEKYDTQRNGKKEEWRELRNYVFATDTSTTTNGTLPWKNSTTIPKLCQIRDNLHSNYLSGLFPNDQWLRWLAYSPQDAAKAKASVIESYIKNKSREGGLRTTASKLLYDYIDYGNAFVTVDFVAEYKDVDGEKVPQYIGPKAYRISPLDIVFDPLADDFQRTWKIVRSIKSVGEVKLMAASSPDNADMKAAIEERESISKALSGYNQSDFEKADAYCVDGFGNLQEYYQSGYVEFLEFYGDLHNPETGELESNKILTVMDRRSIVRDKDIPSWLGHAPIYHSGWRFRPDNLWAMGPLDNLVGMQYRIDHLENLKADAMDLTVHPPLKIIGEVEEFEWGPGAEIVIDENGDVVEMGKNLNGVLAANNEISVLESRMEMYAGAPREAMGIRTQGEKTAYEVQSLENAAGRIFQEKITSFEINLLEPLLNAMLEVSRRNMDGSDIIRTLDDDLAVAEFSTITKEDITGSGVIRPIGARHFAAQAQQFQNILGLMNSGLAEKLAPHVSGVTLSQAVEDLLGIERYGLFSPYAAVEEGVELQRRQAIASQQLQEEMATGEEEDL